MLQNQKILVTRPAGQAEALAGKIEQAGGRAIVFPVIEIQAVESVLDELERSGMRQDCLIFISANAAELGLPRLFRPAETVEVPALAAVGAATARRMAELGYPPRWVPTSRFDSEGLLALEAFAAERIRDRKIMLVKGEGGRELLATRLRERGAVVSEAAIYRRVCPRPDLSAHPWTAGGEVDAIIVTSAEGLNNLLRILGNPDWLRRKKLIVISPRLGEIAMAEGFRQVRVAAEASDEGLFAQLF